MKVLLAVGAVMVALLAGALTGGVLTASGEESPARTSVAEVAAPDEDEASEERADGNPAARAFVAAKKQWTACVAKAAPAHDRADGRFDPEQACGMKPHPHDIAGKHGGKKLSKKHGPSWAGGPNRRTAEPPGHAKRD